MKFSFSNFDCRFEVKSLKHPYKIVQNFNYKTYKSLVMYKP